MKTENRIIVASTLLGLLVWVIDALLDHYIFYEGTFLDLLIFDIPNHEIYIRFVILFTFVIFGIIISKIIIIRKQIEETLRLHSEMLENMGEGVYLVRTDDGTIVHTNPRFEEMFGYESGEMIGQHVSIVNAPTEVSPEEKVDIIMEKLMQDGVWHGEIQNIKKDGTTFWCHANVSVFDHSKYGKVLVSVHEDITDRKLADEKLKQYSEDLKRSNELKDLFTDILRHDLLNPAGIIKGYTELLLVKEGDKNKTKYLHKIKSSNEKLIDIIETAANFAKLESVDELEFEAKDIAIIIKDVVDNFIHQIENRQIEFEFKAKGTYRANVNPVIEEVFANMLSNAIKYSPPKSKIIVDVTDVGENWKVTVTDSGEGISDENKPLLFERFKRVNKSCIKGTGLGLAIVKRIIELHGGDVGVEDNSTGDGCVFWVTIKKV